MALLQIDRLRARRLAYYLGYMARKGRNILLILIASIFAGGLLLALLDGKPLGEGVYLALITATTIGYGDLSPETWAARVVAVAIGVNGLLLTGIVVALAVKALELTYREEMERMEAAKKRRRTGGTGGGEG